MMKIPRNIENVSHSGLFNFFLWPGSARPEMSPSLLVIGFVSHTVSHAWYCSFKTSTRTRLVNTRVFEFLSSLLIRRLSQISNCSSIRNG